MLEWEHFREPSVVTVFLVLLLSAESDGKTGITNNDIASVTHLHQNTVKRAIAKLVESGEITRQKCGPKITTSITNWSEYQSVQKLDRCDNLSVQKLDRCDNLSVQKLSVDRDKNSTDTGTKIVPIQYNKNNKNNKNIIAVAETRAHTHEEFVENALTDLAVERGCMAMRITPDQYRQLVTEVTNDWIYRQLPDNEWTLTHLLAQMRIKNNINNRENGTNKIPGQQNDPIDKLNNDAAKAMAALKSESQHPTVVPF
jgi:hypothetical protein